MANAYNVRSTHSQNGAGSYMSPLLQDKIKQAIIEALKGIPELNGTLPGEIFITTPSLSYHVEFDVPMPVSFGGA
jgi:hypothetical protein